MTARWRRPSIRTRLALIYTGLLAAALIVFGTGVFLVLRAQVTEAFDATLRTSAEHAADAISQDIAASGALAPNPRLIAQFAATGGRVAVVDAQGRVLADSSRSDTPLPVNAQDLAAGAAHSNHVRETTTRDDIIRVTVEPIAKGGAPVGYVVWVASARPLRELLQSVVVSLLVGGVVVVLIALVVGLVLARRALAPVAHVTETARAISLKGDFAGRVEVTRADDEVGELAVAFNEMLAALESSHSALQRFLGHASHELRSPLTTVRANLQLARRDSIPESERREILADASDEAERMSRLVADLLSLARADSGQRLESLPVELDALLVEAVRHQRIATPDVHCAITSVEPATVLGDRDRLLELLGILLDNAGRYTPAGGSVAASVEVRSGTAVVRVVDSGIGLTEDERDRIFERLYRGTRAREMRPSGTGLGLAIAWWIADIHGGRIEVVPDEGGGTMATVRLPLAPG